MAVLEVFQQLFDAAASLAPPNSNPLFFWGTLLLAFSILYVALSKVSLFQEDRWKPAQILVALIMAYFAASSAFTVVLFAELFPNFAIVVIAILVFLILAGMVGFDFGNRTVMIIMLIAVIWLFMTTGLQFIDISGTGVDVFQEWEIVDWVIIAGIIIALLFVFPGAREKIGLG